MATPILIASRTKSMSRAIAYRALMRPILHSEGMLRGCLWYIFALLTFNLSPGNSPAGANINSRGDGSDNSDSHKSANQIDKTDNIVSGAHRAHSSLQGYAMGMSLFAFGLLIFNLRSGDSSAKAKFGIRTDCSSNSESPTPTDQIDNTGNTLSSTHKAHSSPQRYATGMSLVCISSFHH